VGRRLPFPAQLRAADNCIMDSRDKFWLIWWLMLLVFGGVIFTVCRVWGHP
jgi:hypothetical protein